MHQKQRCEFKFNPLSWGEGRFYRFQMFLSWSGRKREGFKIEVEDFIYLLPSWNGESMIDMWIKLEILEVEIAFSSNEFA
jgi:hypothetical protein